MRATPGTINAVRKGETQFSRPVTRQVPAMDAAVLGLSVGYPSPSLNGSSRVDVAGETTSLQPPTPTRTAREERLLELISLPAVPLGATRDEGLRCMAWLGVAEPPRPTVWRLLTGYMSVSADRRQRDLQRKRREYFEYVAKYYTHGVLAGRATEEERKLHDQILLDLPRHSMSLYRCPDFRTRLERVLYIWSLRHPASGYVQGMDDIVFPFFVVFLEGRLSEVQYNAIDGESLNTIEADVYWCGGTLLGWIQDHYTFAQPGVQLMVHRFQHVMQTVDADLYVHLSNLGLTFMLFGYQWMHCLLVRELPMNVLCRLWDTYLAEAHGFSEFHVFVCASLLLLWRDRLMNMKEFDTVLKFLQVPPTESMTIKDVDCLVSKAYLLQTQYQSIK